MQLALDRAALGGDRAGLEDDADEAEVHGHLRVSTDAVVGDVGAVEVRRMQVRIAATSSSARQASAQAVHAEVEGGLDTGDEGVASRARSGWL